MIRFVIRSVLVGTVATTLGAAAVQAQTPPSQGPSQGQSQGPNQPSGSDDRRFQFNQVDDGYLRLDLKTGEVSQCKARAIGWSCLTVADERAALDSEIARLQGENAAMKKAMLDRGLPLPSGVVAEAAPQVTAPQAAAPPAVTPPAAPPPTARDDSPTLRMPSDADIDRMMTTVEKVWRRMLEMMNNLQKDLLKKT
jgi:hypothetical protein